MNSLVFFTGLLVIILGLAVWILRPDASSRASKIKFFGVELSSGVPAFVVVALGIVLMVLSRQFPEYLSAPPVPVKRIVCTGEHEENCPGQHDMYFTCGYFGTDQQIAHNVCAGMRAGALRLKTVSGNQCGYSLIEVTCKPE